MISLNKTSAQLLPLGSEIDALELEVSGIPGGTSVTFESSDETIATVDEDGKVQTIAEGTAVITASAGVYGSATCTLYVHDLDYKDSDTVTANSTYSWDIAYDDEVEPKPAIEVEDVTLDPELEGWSAEAGEYDEETGKIAISVTVPADASASDTLAVYASITVGESTISDHVTLTVGE